MSTPPISSGRCARRRCCSATAARRRADVAALEDLLLRIGVLADELPQVRELDCNPVVVRADGVVAVDIKIHLVRTPDRPTADVRRLRAPS